MAKLICFGLMESLPFPMAAMPLHKKKFGSCNPVLLSIHVCMARVTSSPLNATHQSKIPAIHGRNSVTLGPTVGPTVIRNQCVPMHLCWDNLLPPVHGE